MLVGMRTLARPLVMLSLLWAAPAFACGYDPSAPPPPPVHRPVDDFVAASLVVAGSGALAFVGLDIGFAADGRALPHALGVVQAVYGTLLIAASTILAVAGGLAIGSSCGTSPLDLAMFSSGLAFHVVGGWLLAHGIWSTRVPERVPSASIVPRLAIAGDGAILGLAASF